jgi:hypothetical protein
MGGPRSCIVHFTFDEEIDYSVPKDWYKLPEENLPECNMSTRNLEYKKGWFRLYFETYNRTFYQVLKSFTEESFAKEELEELLNDIDNPLELLLSLQFEDSDNINTKSYLYEDKHKEQLALLYMVNIFREILKNENKEKITFYCYEC